VVVRQKWSHVRPSTNASDPQRAVPVTIPLHERGFAFGKTLRRNSFANAAVTVEQLLFFLFRPLTFFVPAFITLTLLHIANFLPVGGIRFPGLPENFFILFRLAERDRECTCPRAGYFGPDEDVVLLQVGDGLRSGGTLGIQSSRNLSCESMQAQHAPRLALVS